MGRFLKGLLFAIVSSAVLAGALMLIFDELDYLSMDEVEQVIQQWHQNDRAGRR
jgi:hypothetical protein